MSRVGISSWGICADFKDHQSIHIDTPDGHRYGRPLLVRALEQKGHRVFALQKRREPERFSEVEYVLETPEMVDGEIGPWLGFKQRTGSYVDKRPDDPTRFPDLDVVFLEYRWPTFKNDRTHKDHDPTKYEPDLDRQREVIEYYKDKCPIIVWDTDLKITPEFEDMHPYLILADPSFDPVRLVHKRESLPFWTDWKELFSASDPYPLYGYCGNNYDRPDEFEKYYFGIQHQVREQGIQISMYGNWLQTSPEREHPKSLIQRNRQIAFNHRMNFYDSMQMINRFICTTHVSKPSYYQSGFISPRFIEAIACNCPGLVPAAQRYNSILGRSWIVNGGQDVLTRLLTLKDLSANQRQDVINEQKSMMKKKGSFDVSHVVSFIESKIK